MNARVGVLLGGLMALSWSLLGPVPAQGSPAPPAAPACSWLAHSDDDTVNVAYPDTSATYWLTAFSLSPGQTLSIDGTYPDARYFSFHSYTATGLTEDSQYDAQLRPAAGSGNPFVAAAAGSARHYELTVRPGPPPGQRPANTLYTGTVPQTGATLLTGTLIYRVYTPTRAGSLAGDVPLPAITVRDGDGAAVTELGHCSSAQPTTAGAIDGAYDQLGYPASGPSIPVPNATRVPTWKRAASDLKVAGLFGNQQNAYLTSRTSLQYGEVLVVHAKAPSFPDTAAGVPAYRRSQVRYWSMCQNSVSTRVVACVPDAAAPLRDGAYTIVISPAAARPATADRAHGVAWLPWGAQPDGLLIYRNMVAAPGFAHATQRVGAADDPAPIMGDYYPAAHYCSTASYDAVGPLRCTA